MVLGPVVPVAPAPDAAVVAVAIDAGEPEIEMPVAVVPDKPRHTHVDREPRRAERPSDHAPVIAEFMLQG